MATGMPIACVMGDMDLVRPLGLRGIPCAVVAGRGSPARYSRFARTILDWEDFSERPEELAAMLVRYGSRQPSAPVLFYESDAQLLFLSRHRDLLAEVFRFVVADAELVEDLVDKARFQVLAERLALPVPRTRQIQPAAGSTPTDIDLGFPLMIKPLTRWKSWEQIGGSNKALEVETPAALRGLWPRLAESGMAFLAQERIPGPETRVESYHVYVDWDGKRVGEFTGRKIRTRPVAYGHSTALEIADLPDVASLGRELVQRMGLRGVAKLDFKRSPDGRLYLLEVNPRFNLWHHPGAIAGVNLPALVYADLVGLPRQAPSVARAGVRWCRIWRDLAAAKEWGVPLPRWLLWVARCEAKSAVSWDDPMPFVHGLMLWSRSARDSAVH
ncbi:MAG: ATP-grasp domain-containing protein [Armatimonadota bacterium]